MASRIQIRRDTAVNWTEANPVLAQGEFGVETDTLKLKIGDGVTFWNDLRYYHSGSPYDAGEGISIDDMVISNTGIITLGTGTQNGTVKANGTDVFVKGLGSAAYTASTDYATAAQGTKADTAVQPGDLATVATTGDYDDLLNKPTIPTVNNATLTIQKNGTTVNTFTANASSNVTANISVPTKISDLTNDSNFANTDLSNLTSTGANIGNWSSNVSNCITEIPQDIKLELSSGTLTLKAGSKLHMADGNLEVTTTISTDITRTSSYNGQHMLILYGNAIFSGYIDSCLSGTIANRPNSTAHTAGIYFATDENKIYVTNDSGATWVHAANMSMPLAVVTVSGGAISSIDQVFNGFGYIGSTVFALPGVKGLIPNGRNADGSLKNIATITSDVRTLTITTGNTGTKTLTVTQNGNIDRPGGLTYDSINNYNYNFGSLTRQGNCGSFTIDNNYKITSFEPKTAFHAVDYNDTEYIAHQAMPSDRYVDLTLGTSGATYTAPADGYFTIAKTSGVANTYLSIDVVSNNERIINAFTETSTTTRGLALSVPVSKGNIAYIYYNATGTINRFRFVYANGSK